MATAELLTEARELLPATVLLRRTIHRNPEQGLQLPATQAAVVDALADLPLRVHTGTSTTSVVAVLDGARPGPTAYRTPHEPSWASRSRFGVVAASFPVRPPSAACARSPSPSSRITTIGYTRPGY